LIGIDDDVSENVFHLRWIDPRLSGGSVFLDDSHPLGGRVSFQGEIHEI
jgi:hypothetical protein